jgi:hypothetical protein
MDGKILNQIELRMELGKLDYFNRFDKEDKEKEITKYINRMELAFQEKKAYCDGYADAVNQFKQTFEHNEGKLIDVLDELLPCRHK